MNSTVYNFRIQAISNSGHTSIWIYLNESTDALPNIELPELPELPTLPTTPTILNVNVDHQNQILNVVVGGSTTSSPTTLVRYEVQYIDTGNAYATWNTKNVTIINNSSANYSTQLIVHPSAWRVRARAINSDNNASWLEYGGYIFVASDGDIGGGGTIVDPGKPGGGTGVIDQPGLMP